MAAVDETDPRRGLGGRHHAGADEAGVKLSAVGNGRGLGQGVEEHVLGPGRQEGLGLVGVRAGVEVVERLHAHERPGPRSSRCPERTTG